MSPLTLLTILHVPDPTAESPASVRLRSTNANGDNGANGGPEATSSKNSSLIAQITSLPGFDPTKARIVKHVSSKFTPSSSNTNIGASGQANDVANPQPTRPTLERPERLLPTAAESFLPWRRDRSYQSFGTCVSQLSSFVIAASVLAQFVIIFYLLL